MQNKKILAVFACHRFDIGYFGRHRGHNSTKKKNNNNNTHPISDTIIGQHLFWSYGRGCQILE